MCSLFSVGSRTSTGQVSSTVYAGMRAAAKTPLPTFFTDQLLVGRISVSKVTKTTPLTNRVKKYMTKTKQNQSWLKKSRKTRMHFRDIPLLYGDFLPLFLPSLLFPLLPRSFLLFFYCIIDVKVKTKSKHTFRGIQHQLDIRMSSQRNRLPRKCFQFLNTHVSFRSSWCYFGYCRCVSQAEKVLVLSKGRGKYVKMDK